jgi:phage shock protein A
MGLIDRVGRVISSNFNALLDRLEDPGRSIDQILSDMKAELRSARQEVVRAVAFEKQLRAKSQGLESEAKRWEDRAVLALEKGDEPLARAALEQKRRVVAERERAETLRAEQLSAALEMRSELERMQTKVEEVQARRSTLAAEIGMARSGAGADGLGHKGSGPVPLQELRRMEDQIEGIEASVEAERELDGLFEKRASGMSTAEVEARFRELEQGAAAPAENAEIEGELTRLKQKIRVKV